VCLSSGLGRPGSQSTSAPYCKACLSGSRPATQLLSPGLSFRRLWVAPRCVVLTFFRLKGRFSRTHRQPARTCVGVTLRNKPERGRPGMLHRNGCNLVLNAGLLLWQLLHHTVRACQGQSLFWDRTTQSIPQLVDSHPLKVTTESSSSDPVSCTESPPQCVSPRSTAPHPGRQRFAPPSGCGRAPVH
jgi:hypothetical protein